MEESSRRVWPTTAAIGFDRDLWEAVRTAAEQVGLSAEEYIREAVMARLAAETAPDDPTTPAQRALQARLAAVASRNEAAALRAQAKQAVHHAGATAVRSRDVLAPKDGGLGNIGYVRGLWAAFEAGGVSAMAGLVPPDVRWRPSGAGGRVLRGTAELAEFWACRDAEVPSPRMFHGRGDDVLVEAERRPDDEHVTTIWLLYRFDGDRLIEAIAFPDEAQARGYRPAATGYTRSPA
jgi:hypothetical protein